MKTSITFDYLERQRSIEIHAFSSFVSLICSGSTSSQRCGENYRSICILPISSHMSSPNSHLIDESMWRNRNKRSFRLRVTRSNVKIVTTFTNRAMITFGRRHLSGRVTIYSHNHCSLRFQDSFNLAALPIVHIFRAPEIFRFFLSKKMNE